MMPETLPPLSRRRKGGRPKGDPAAVRAITLGVRVSPSEYAALKDKAAHMGVTPAQWVRSSNNLAITLKKLADETGDPAPLRQAVGIYRDVVATTSRESMPLDWADYQQNLGNALAALAEYEDPAPNLDAALAAYDAAGEITTVARGASKWQGLQTAIATTLLMKGLKTMDRAPVLEAQQITLAARDRMRELGAPADDFYTQYLAAVDKVLAILPK